MARSSNALPLALVALVSSGLLYRPAGDASRLMTAPADSRAAAGLSDATGDGANEKAKKKDQDNKESDKPKPDLHRDALDVLGEHCGIDLTDDGLLARARAAAQVLLLGPLKQAQPVGNDLREAFVRSLRPTVGDMPLSDGTKTRLSGSLASMLTRPQEDRISRLDTSSTNSDAAHKFLEAYSWQERDNQRLLVLRTSGCAINVQTVVATLPDPIDSNVRWLFDPMVDAIQRAASSSGYVLDRFYIPDWNPEASTEADHSSEPVGAHERWPGVLLFRDARSENRGRAPLLMVFLVSEIATSGVHQLAFEQALRYSAMLRMLPAPDPALANLKDLAVLGPSFSGSADSMRKTLARFLDVHKAASIRIVSGGATSPGLRKEFEQDPKLGSRVSYRSTVLPDDILLEGLARYLVHTDPSLEQPGTIAILQEANTSYGQGYVSHAVANVKKNADGDKSAGSDQRDVQKRRIFDTAIRLPFPMHISRIRSDAQAVRPRDPPKLPQAPQAQRFRSLTLQDPSTPSDQIPAFSTQLTSSSVELMLANIIDTIKRQRVRAVGLVATDTRDKLFLAQQISNFAPGVTLFTIESDLLFVHPDYNKYVRGMLIASSYPLFAQNQLSAAPDDRSFQLQQFPTTNSEGVYNALLALVAYDAQGSPLLWFDPAQEPAQPQQPPPPLLDYRPPAPESCVENMCIPPVWISVVASDALWPIDYSLASNIPSSTTVQRAQVVGTGRAPFVRPSTGMVFLLAAFTGIALAGAGLFAYWQFWLSGREEDFKGFNRAAKATAYQAVALAAIAVAGLPIAFDCLIAVCLVWPSLGSLDAFLYVIVVVAEVLAIAALVVALWAPREKAAGAALPKYVGPLRVTTGTIALGFVLFGAWRAVQTLWNLSQYPGWPIHHTRYAERVLQLGTGVSPIVPVVLLILPVLCWAVLHLWRIGGPRLDRIYDAPWIARLSGGTPPAEGHVRSGWQRDLQLAWTSPTRGLPASFLAVVLAGLAATGVLFVSAHPSTIEPATFSQFLAALWVVAQLCIALTLVHAVRLWSLNRALLAKIAASPLAEAFGRLPRDTAFHGYLSPAPQRADLVRPVQFYLALADGFPTLAGSFDAGLKKEFEEPRPDLAAMEYRPWSNTTIFAILVQRGSTVYEGLCSKWKNARSNFFTRERDLDTQEPLERWMLRAEEYLAMLLTLVVRQLISRVMRQLLFVTLALVFVIAALSSFPINPLQPLIGCAWIWAASAAATGIWVSVTMERDPILSRLTGTAPNKVTWNLAFTTKLLVYVGIPVLTLFAAQFPQFGGTLLRWLAPIQPLP